MVLLTDVQASNSGIASTLPSGLVAVFVGATAGIGATSLKQFAQHARQPRVYFTGRSEGAGNRIATECKELNPEGEFIFVRADTSLIRNVDEICEDIKKKEDSINLLFMSSGTLIVDQETDERLPYIMALSYYSRTRFIVNLLPLMRQATNLRRVVSVFCGGKEGQIYAEDIRGWKVPLLGRRGHAASVVTLSLEMLAKEAPEVSFIHNFPGSVKTNIAKGTKGLAMSLLKTVSFLLGPFVYIPNKECGERHLFLATSAKFPAGLEGDSASGVPLAKGQQMAASTAGKIGGGVYSVAWDCESAGAKTESVLAKLRDQGMVETVWKHTEDEFKRITGGESI